MHRFGVDTLVGCAPRTNKSGAQVPPTTGEQSRDFIQWVGYSEAKLEREARYREMM
jgi:hypothetical protein